MSSAIAMVSGEQPHGAEDVGPGRDVQQGHEREGQDRRVKDRPLPAASRARRHGGHESRRIRKSTRVTPSMGVSASIVKRRENAARKPSSV